MPRFEGGMAGVDEDSPGGRFNRHIALALVASGEGTTPPADAITDIYGEWVLQQDAALGKGTAHSGSAGRGAASSVAVAEWLVEAFSHGVIDVAVAAAAAALVSRLRRERPDNKPGATILVSRGAAAALAADHVYKLGSASQQLVVEAVEEPSSIAGWPPTELSYVGLEPWIVLLLDHAQKTRYVV
ncbi:MAG TPA: hypothetical protein VHU90_13625, partial [Galbitalea sp.]|nr:hypothetical protein [Galbitalea sp.]